MPDINDEENLNEDTLEGVEGEPQTQEAPSGGGGISKMFAEAGQCWRVIVLMIFIAMFASVGLMIFLKYFGGLLVWVSHTPHVPFFACSISKFMQKSHEEEVYCKAPNFQKKTQKS